MVLVRKAKARCICRRCGKQMESKDWAAVSHAGKFFHLSCYLKACEKSYNWYLAEIREIKRHKHLLKKEHEKLIMRAI